MNQITFAEKMYRQSIPAFNSRGKGVSPCSDKWLMLIEKFQSNCQSAQSSWKMIGSIYDLWPWIKWVLGNIPHHNSSFVTKISSTIVVYRPGSHTVYHTGTIKNTGYILIQKCIQVPSPNYDSSFVHGIRKNVTNLCEIERNQLKCVPFYPGQ